jgi:hypothetical protein
MLQKYFVQLDLIARVELAHCYQVNSKVFLSTSQAVMDTAV